MLFSAMTHPRKQFSGYLYIAFEFSLHYHLKIVFRTTHSQYFQFLYHMKITNIWISGFKFAFRIFNEAKRYDRQQYSKTQITIQT